MKEQQSIFLDAMRFGASFLVVLHHFLQLEVIGPRLAPYVPDLGHEAVLAFFVLSGFVIRFVTTRRETTPRDYALARAARIYSVALPMVLFAMLLDGAGVLLGETADVRVYQYEKAWLYLPLNLAFLGQSWTLTETPFSVLPYWSLCYEVAYYALFGVLIFSRGAKRAIGLTLLCLLAGPKIWLLAPAWMLGVFLFDLQERGGPWRSRGVARALCVTSLAAVVGLRYSGLREAAARQAHALLDGPSTFSETLLGNSEPFLFDWAIALLVALSILTFPHTDWSFGPRLTRAVRWCASFTFTLYLVHVPLILFAKRQVGIDPDQPLHASALLAVILAATVVLGSFTEHKKHVFLRALRRVFAGTPAARS